MRFRSSSKEEGKPLSFGEIATQVTIASKEIMRVVVEKSKQASIDDYKSKRKTSVPISQSKIISSFKYELSSSNSFQVIGVVFAGGPSAPYMQYVDEGHKLRNNKGVFSGYGFMEVGFKAGEAALEEETIKMFQ